MSNHETVKHLVEQYQCPGCVIGSDTSCGKFCQSETCYDDSGACGAHCAGTSILGGGRLYLGLPRGMNKVGDGPSGRRIRIWPKGSKGPGWDVFNIPVWFKMDEGNLIVKTVLPRRMEIYTDIIEGGNPEMLKDVCAKGFLVGELESDFKLTPFDVTPHEEID